MFRITAAAAICSGLMVAGGTAAAAKLPDINIAPYFAGIDGCFVLTDSQGNVLINYNPERAAKRLPPCSTFKIFNALAALDAGVADGPEFAIPWDKKQHEIEAWNHDHTLASAISASAVWYFQELATRIGDKKMQEYLDRIGYGNRDMSGGLTTFWLGSSLEISAMEQLTFLQNLYNGKLAVSPKAMDAVQKMLVLESGEGFEWSGKTGTNTAKEASVLGWFVGSVKQGDTRYFTALNFSASDGATGARAKDLTKHLLQKLGLLSVK